MYVLMSKRIAQERPSSCFLTTGVAGLMKTDFQLYYIFSHIHSYTTTSEMSTSVFYGSFL
jgi:hypothetical protein